jgi:KAP family P-loop domain
MQIRSSDLEIPTNDPFENDCLARRELEPPLTQFVTQAVGPFVLAIDGSWGSGKTTFLKMWQVKLDEAGHLCLYLNAWKTDFVQDPLVAVVGELSIAIEEHPRNLLAKDNVEATIQKIEEKTKLIAKRLIPVGVRFLTHGLVNIEPAMEKILADLAGETTQDLIGDYNTGKSDIEGFRESLSSLATAIQEPNQDPVKIVIIIDELDRCRPTYAVQLLERIKHLFDVEGVVFVLGIDRKQLSHSIKALYGLKFDAAGYLKRFIDIDYCLPEPSLESYCFYLFERFEINSLLSKRQLVNNNNNSNDLNDLKFYLGYLMSSTRMSLRDREQIISKLRVILQTIAVNQMPFPVTLSILLFLYHYNAEKYNLVISGNLEFKDFLAFVETLQNEKEAFQYYSKIAENTNYSGFSKVRLEGIFLSCLRELSNTVCPEIQEYTNILKSIENTTPGLQKHIPGLASSGKSIVEIQDIVEIARRGAGLKETDRRLNLISNFVQY